LSYLADRKLHQGRGERDLLAYHYSAVIGVERQIAPVADQDSEWTEFEQSHPVIDRKGTSMLRLDRCHYLARRQLFPVFASCGLLIVPLRAVQLE